MQANRTIDDEYDHVDSDEDEIFEDDWAGSDEDVQ